MLLPWRGKQFSGTYSLRFRCCRCRCRRRRNRFAASACCWRCHVFHRCRVFHFHFQFSPLAPVAHWRLTSSSRLLSISLRFAKTARTCAAACVELRQRINHHISFLKSIYNRSVHKNNSFKCEYPQKASKKISEYFTVGISIICTLNIYHTSFCINSFWLSTLLYFISCNCVIYI